jgi:hypothetical protein
MVLRRSVAAAAVPGVLVLVPGVLMVVARVCVLMLAPAALMLRHKRNLSR